MCPSGEIGVTHHLAAIHGPEDDSGPIEVMEAMPTLDALEAWYGILRDAHALPNQAYYAAWREMGDFLVAHGRFHRTVTGGVTGER
jgi:hypothetical protein